MPVEVTWRERSREPAERAHAAPPLASVTPVASCEHLLLGRTGGQLAGEPAVAHHEDPVGHADHLGQLAGDHQDADAVGGEGAHQLVDAVLGADVDAAGGLVHQHDLRRRGEPPGEHDLLLVAAGEELDLLVERAGGHLQRGEQPGHLAARGADVRRGNTARTTPSALSRMRLVERQAGGLAVLGDHGEPAAHGLPRGRRADARAGHDHLAAGERADAEDRLEQLGAAGALEPGDAHDLAGAQGQVDAVDVAVAGAAQLEPGLADLGALDRVGEERGDRATDHQPDQRGVVEVGGRLGRDLLAVLEDGDRVAEVEDLLEPVGDVEDGDAALGEAADDGVEELDLVVGQRGGRLVHLDDPGVEADRLGDLDDLLLGDRQRADPLAGADAGDAEAARAAPGCRAASWRCRPSRAGGARDRGRCSRRPTAPAAG